MTFVAFFRKQDSRLCQEAAHVNKASGGDECTHIRFNTENMSPNSHH
jgi:hypothetical protein